MGWIKRCFKICNFYVVFIFFLLIGLNELKIGVFKLKYFKLKGYGMRWGGIYDVMLNN